MLGERIGTPNHCWRILKYPFWKRNLKQSEGGLRLELARQEKELRHTWCWYFFSGSSHDYGNLLLLHIFHAARVGAAVVRTALSLWVAVGWGRSWMEEDSCIGRIDRMWHDKGRIVRAKISAGCLEGLGCLMLSEKWGTALRKFLKYVIVFGIQKYLLMVRGPFNTEMWNMDDSSWVWFWMCCIWSADEMLLVETYSGVRLELEFYYFSVMESLPRLDFLV